MNIDTEHIRYWMQAIRNSKDPMRTLDAFWSGQLKSKEWLIDNLDEFIHHAVTIDICGGWVGVLASMLFQSNIPIQHIKSSDIDPTVESIATDMNKIEEISGRFKAVTVDMCWSPCISDVIINTNCEHLTQEQYDDWLDNQVISEESIIVLQSNNYNIEEHIRLAQSLDEFKKQSHLSKILFEGTLELPLYNRYMLIGHK
jgi:hypothetical protein